MEQQELGCGWVSLARIALAPPPGCGGWGISVQLSLTPELAQLPRLFSEESRFPASFLQDSKFGTTWGE